MLGKMQGAALYPKRGVRHTSSDSSSTPRPIPLQVTRCTNTLAKICSLDSLSEKIKKISKTKPLSISFADNSGLELSYPSNEPCPVLHSTLIFSEYKVTGTVRN